MTLLRGRTAFVLAVAFLTPGASMAQSAAGSARSSVLAEATVKAQPIPCVAQADGVRVCHGEGKGPSGTDLRIKSFDGTPLTLYVTLPPAPASGRDGGYPLVIQSHGWGAPPSGPDDSQYGGPTARQWAMQGYAVVQLAARGWGASCGSIPSRLLDLRDCMKGYVRRADMRYEIRDAQYVAGLLVDDGVADGKRIGAHGESYGGGTSLALATLNDRVMNLDGTLRPWTSPKGAPLHLAAAAPFAGWSIQTLALAPNGHWLDTDKRPMGVNALVGVQKMSISRGLFQVGLTGSYYPQPGDEPDLVMEFAVSAAGEPYTGAPVEAILKKDAQFHSSYHLLAGTLGNATKAPAPLLLSNGFTDDVFWADQVLMYYNLLRTKYPSAPVDVLFGDIGHQRAQSKPADLAVLVTRVQAFFDHYVKGGAPQPALAVTALTQTCPKSAASVSYTAATWEALHPGVISFGAKPAQTITSTGGDPKVAKAFDPVTGPGACATAPAVDEGKGVATYRLPAASGAGYTLLGSPTITADLKVTGQYAYIAGRLVDVDPATNTKTLISRGAYRIDPKAPNGRQTFQLSANGWHFAPGHFPQLELLGQDAPFLRPSNGTFSIVVSNLELLLPTHEAKP